MEVRTYNPEGDYGGASALLHAGSETFGGQFDAA